MGMSELTITKPHADSDVGVAYQLTVDNESAQDVRAARIETTAFSAAGECLACYHEEREIRARAGDRIDLGLINAWLRNLPWSLTSGMQITSTVHLFNRVVAVESGIPTPAHGVHHQVTLGVPATISTIASIINIAQTSAYSDGQCMLMITGGVTSQCHHDCRVGLDVALEDPDSEENIQMTTFMNDLHPFTSTSVESRMWITKGMSLVDTTLRVKLVSMEAVSRATFSA